ncbi:MAG: Aerobic respiration control sensor protein ArcB [Lentisphaerae bacterium ADurb.Bin242]|nr:MAG: Aerobic respiration control sensor protein ArcB [Lentisphaerae bacterium ADurb.Bin242]
MGTRGASGKKRRFFFLLVFLFFLFPLLSQTPPSPAPAAKKILLISPFNLSFAQYYQQVTSYLDVLSHSGVSYLLTHMENDTLNQSPEGEAVQRDFAAHLAKIRAGEYDIIVTFGEKAFDLIRENVRQIPPKTVVIFCGQETSDKKSILSLPNTVGVFQQVSPEENIRLARLLFPKKKKLLLLTNWTPAGKRIKLQTEIYLRQNPGLELLYIDNATTSTEAMFSRIADLGPDTMILFYGWYNRRVINFASLEYLMHRLGNRPDVPVFVMFDSMLRFPVVGGYVEQGKRMGMEAAEKTIRILRGEKISDLEDSLIPQALVLNWEMLKYYQVDSSLVPKNATLPGKPVSFWDRHGEILIPAMIYMALLSLFTVVLVIVVCRCRKISRRMKAILSHLPMRLAIADSKGKIYYNYCEDYSVPEFNGRLFSLREFPAELYETFRESIQRVFRTGAPLSLEYVSENRRRRADFVKVPPEIFGTDTVMWASIDIEELHQAKLHMEELMKRFKLTLDSVGDGVIATEADGTIMLVNPVAESMIGSPAGELIGQKMELGIRLVNAADDTPVPFSCPSSPVPASAEFDIVLIARNGTRYHVETKSAPLREPDGTVSGAVTVIHDITGERQLNSRLRIYAEQQKIINSILEKILLDINDDNGAMRLALQTFCGHLKADRCFLHQFDEEQNWILTLLEYSEGEKKFVPVTLRSIVLPEEDRWLRMLKNHEALVFPDFDVLLRESKAKFFYDNIPDKKTHSLFAAGIFDGGRLWGAVALVFERKNSPLSEQDMQLLWGIAHMIEIILERKKRRTQLERSESEKLLILDNIRIPIFFFGADFHLICANRAAEKLMSESQEELSCRCCLKHPCDSDCPSDCPIRFAFQDHKMHVKELKIAEREYQLFASPIVIHEKLEYVLANLIDVTDFNTSQHRLTSALMEAQNASRAKSLFLATVSHELRTPLNAVIGFSDLLKQGPLPEQQEKEYLNSIHVAGHALLELIDDILDFSRIEADQVVLSPRETHLAATVAGLQSVFNQKAGEKGISLTFEIPSDIPLLIMDDFKFRQILTNLIGNAVKFTNRGYVRVSFDFLAETVSEGTLSVSVKDTGIGIRRDCQQVIFEPFVQQDTVRDAHFYKGSGLGLAISRRLARKMGGDILLESTPGEGSVFTLVLKNIPFRQGMPVTEPSREENALGLFPGVKVLLVDDVPLNLQVLSVMLKKLGIEAVSADSGDAALKWLENNVPDFVLTDMWMPGLDGTELAKRIRANPAYSGVKLISVTADVIAETTFDMKAFNDILLKPITLDKLSALFEKFQKERGEK